MDAVDVALDAELPLTCTRLGTCCHGKQVWINPWELACLARTRAMTPADFRRAHTTAGGVRLAFTGAPGWRGLPACSQYDPAAGCRAHAGRPLACRLYPLGRERRGERTRWLHDGPDFPCLAGCPGVTALPPVRVRDYLAQQDVAAGVAASDAYLEVVQDLAEGAFVLWFDSGLAASGDRATLPRWRRLVALDAETRAPRIAGEWLDRLTVPAVDLAGEGAATRDAVTLGPGAMDGFGEARRSSVIAVAGGSSVPPADGHRWSEADSRSFIIAHAALLQRDSQAAFATLREPAALRDASCLMLALALQLAQSLGADAAALGERWLATAVAQGAR